MTSPPLSDITVTTVEGDGSAVFLQRDVWCEVCGVSHLQPVVGEQCFLC